MARTNPMRVCFAAVSADEDTVPYGYQQARLLSAALAWRLKDMGVEKGSYVLVDLPNMAVYPLLVLAAAYGGFGLIPLNFGLPEMEKSARVYELRRMLGSDLAFVVDKTNVMPLIRWAIDFLAGKHEVRRDESSLGANLTQRTLGGKSVRGGSLSLPFTGSRRNTEQSRQSMSKSAQEVCLHYADRQAHIFNEKSPAFIFSTTDGTGSTRLVCHSWSSMLESAHAANDGLGVDQMAVWQCVLPLFTVEGMQVLLRGLCGCNSFVLYQRFDAGRILSDIGRFRVTHIAVEPRRLAALLQTSPQAFSYYRCVLLERTDGGTNIDPDLFDAARRANPHVRVTYGLPETAGMIAVEDDAAFDPNYSLTCAMRPLPGCTVQALGADAQGYGSLGVKTPGLFARYLDGTGGHMRNGFYLTGDVAAVYRDLIYIR